MAKNFPITVIKGDKESDGPLVQFGPLRPLRHPILEISSSIKRRIIEPELGIAYSIDLEFTGERLEIRSLLVEGFASNYVSTTDLTKLGLPNVVRQIGQEAVPNYDYWVPSLDVRESRLGWSELRDDEEFLAQVYLLQHAIHANPRQSLMDLFGFPRSTATFRISAIREKYVLPQGEPKMVEVKN